MGRGDLKRSGRTTPPGKRHEARPRTRRARSAAAARPGAVRLPASGRPPPAARLRLPASGRPPPATRLRLPYSAAACCFCTWLHAPAAVASTSIAMNTSIVVSFSGSVPAASVVIVIDSATT